MKFSVGKPVGGPSTHLPGQEAPEGIAEILGIEGVTSVFTTADFVTVSSDGSVDWDAVIPAIVGILDRSFS